MQVSQFEAQNISHPAQLEDPNILQNLYHLFFSFYITSSHYKKVCF